MQNAFARLTSRLDMAEEKISELQDMSIETSQTEIQREKSENKTKQNRTFKNCRTITKDTIYT